MDTCDWKVAIPITGRSVSLGENESLITVDPSKRYSNIPQLIILGIWNGTSFALQLSKVGNRLAAPAMACVRSNWSRAHMKALP